ncbi:MAG: V-type ATP synthase subunit I [Bacillota bacterium]
MSVEKMYLLNMVGEREKFYDVMQQMILSKSVQFIDAYRQIDQSDFRLSMEEENIDEIINLSKVHKSNFESDLVEIENMIENIISTIGFKINIKEKYLRSSFDPTKLMESIEKIYKIFNKKNKKINNLENELQDLEKMMNIKALKGIDFNFQDFINMENFNIKFGRLSLNNRKRLSMNYENVTAAVMHLDTKFADDLYLVAYPEKLKEETNRILRSVYFDEINIDEKYLDTPLKMIEKIKRRKNEVNEKLSKEKKEVNNLKEEYKEKIQKNYAQFKIYKKIINLSDKIAFTENFFYLSAWVPKSKSKKLEKTIFESTNAIVDYKKESEKMEPPTKLKNNWFFKPFESLVNMYGVPNYNEIDPTAFFTIIYTFLFGAMFGDVGQGLVFFAVGQFLRSKDDYKVFSGILSRIGISSMVFGTIYDSFFGYENIISEFIPFNIYIHPLENINTMLISAIIFGIFLIFISFGYSIYNKLKIKDIEEGIFGRNGIVGLILYSSVLVVILNMISTKIDIDIKIFQFLIFISIALLFFKEPIVNKIEGKNRLYKESASEYYVESGFDLIETFLSIFSNTLSFIRIGAFALNHVGLFIAFHTIADLIGTRIGDVSMFILGNIIIILLEGLIVFIQGLRLMYYEVFSKYYKGDGYKFIPSYIEMEE